MPRPPHIAHRQRSVHVSEDLKSTLPALCLELEQSRQTQSVLGPIRDEKLTAIVTGARRNCLFYRQRYDKEIVENFRGVEDLSTLPLLTRRDVQENLEGLAAKGLGDLSQCSIYSTSGSSGEPLTVLRSRRALLYDSGMMRLIAERYAVKLTLKPWKPAIFFFLDLENFGCLFQRLPMLGFGSFYRFGLGKPGWDDARHTLEFLAAHPGTILSSNPQSLARLQEFSRKEDPKGRYPIRPAFVVSGGAELSEKVSANFGAFFKAPIVNIYSTTEVGHVAIKCPKSGKLHVEDNVVIVECLDAKGNPVKDGETGELVLTDLRNPEFPMIRYQVGDFGTLERGRCECGSEALTISSLDGRTNTLFYTSDRKAVLPAGLNRDLRELPIYQFQVEQRNIDDFLVRYIKDDATTPQRVIDDALLKIFRGVFGESTMVQCQPVANLGEPGKKLHAYLSSMLGS